MLRHIVAPPYISEYLETNIITSSLIKRIKFGSNQPHMFSTITFGFYDNDGKLLPLSEISKFWDKGQVKKTNKLIRNILREALGIEQFWFFIERHSPNLDAYGNEVKKGRYHIHLITTGITNLTALQPNRKCRRYYNEYLRQLPKEEPTGQLPIDQLKIQLFNASCMRADWINRYSHSIKTEILYTLDDLSRTARYCLKTYINEGIDFVDVIDFDNSDFTYSTKGDKEIVNSTRSYRNMPQRIQTQQKVAASIR